METSTVRILVAEDFKAVRAVIVLLLTENPIFRVVCEVEDGLDAVEKAQQLKPDLILMDIGLPKLNGLEAARCISKLVPSSKIVFLTQQTDPALIEEALKLGSIGYVTKARTADDLLRAIGASFKGRDLSARGWAKRSLSEGTQTQRTLGIDHTFIMDVCLGCDWDWHLRSRSCIVLQTLTRAQMQDATNCSTATTMTRQDLRIAS